jgi:hypothetical protein
MRQGPSLIVKRAIRAGAAGLFLAGCTTLTLLTPDQDAGLAEVRRMSQTIAPHVQVEVGTPAHPVLGAQYDARRDVIVFRPSALGGRYREALMAHELGHVVLGHHLMPGSKEERAAREVDAHVAAVGILVTTHGLSEREALGMVYDWLSAASRHEARVGRDGTDHLPACQQAAELLARFPQYETWWARLACTPARVGPARRRARRGRRFVSRARPAASRRSRRCRRWS